MTNEETRTLDRAPLVGDMITVSPADSTLFEVVALDELYGEMVYAQRAGAESPAQWYSLTHVRVIDDEPSTDCHCGHPDCGAC